MQWFATCQQHLSLQLQPRCPPTTSPPKCLPNDNNNIIIYGKSRELMLLKLESYLRKLTNICVNRIMLLNDVNYINYANYVICKPCAMLCNVPHVFFLKTWGPLVFWICIWPFGILLINIWSTSDVNSCKINIISTYIYVSWRKSTTNCQMFEQN